ncbi:MAG: VUT family protein, partial [Saprospiraceae bacterium]
MMKEFFSSKPTRLWMVLSGFFLTNAIVAEYMGVKLFSLEKTLGFEPVNWSMLGQSNLAFTLTAGVLLWPAVFIMTDIINEYYGRRGVRFLSYLTAGLIAYGFIMLYGAIGLEPAEFWRTAHIKSDWTPEHQAAMRAQVSDYNTAYSVVFGQSLWIIVGSLVAFLVSQIIDVGVFHQIKKVTGEDKIWLR